MTVCVATAGLMLAMSIITAQPASDQGPGIGSTGLDSKQSEELTFPPLEEDPDLYVFSIPRLQGQIIPINQRNYYQTLGTCQGCTIKSDGCLLVSLTMAFRFLGIKVMIPERHSSTGEARFGMNPDILNDWFLWKNTYSYNSTSCPGRCLVDWHPLPGNIKTSTRRTNRGEYLTSNTKQNIDYALEHNYPVIAGVHWGDYCPGNPTKSEDCHFVLITGKWRDTYRIIDPAGGIKTTLNNGAFGPYTIDHYRYLKPHP